MNFKKCNDYFIGLDVGSESVGWAVCDADYNLLEKSGEAMWGSHLFDEAKNKEDTRTYRTARRRLRRKKWRIEQLRAMFADEIKDPLFFRRLDCSFMDLEDKQLQGVHTRFSLFSDNDFTDKDYHTKYPTIHHLINDLATSDEYHDPRLLYLAVAYLYGHRGHFLLSAEKDDIKGVMDVSGSLNELKNYLTLEFEKQDINVIFDCEDVKTALLDAIGITNKKEALKNFIVIDGDKKATSAIITLLSGGESTISDIFGDYEEKHKCNFAKKEFEVIRQELLPVLEERFELIVLAKAVYDWSVLSHILEEKTSIAEAKVAEYNKHKVDLTALKALLKGTPQYKEMFNSNTFGSYCSYVGHYIKNGKKQYIKRCKKDDFYKLIKKYIGDEKILDDIKNGDFLPLQSSGANSVIPYQLHYYDLKNMLERAEKYLPFIAQIKDDILKIFEHRIPYFVGPLGTDSKFAWLVKKEEYKNTKITPLNFEKVLDMHKTHEEFIERMLCKCTYLPMESTLPKNSLLYSKYMVLSELNNLKIRTERISAELKLKIYEALFVNSNKKVTTKRLCDFLNSECISDIGEKVDKDSFGEHFAGINANLKSYHEFKRLLDNGILSEGDIEEIIQRITLFTGEKEQIRKWLAAKFPNISLEDVRYILSLRYKDWGNFSRRFLEDIHCTIDGVDLSIIAALHYTNKNLMELLSETHSYKSQVDEICKEYYEIKPPTLEQTLDDMYISNRVRRSIYRAKSIVDEITKIMKKPPKRIFIEMTRSEDLSKKGKKTVSRKEQLVALYKKCKDSDAVALFDELNTREDRDLNSKKLYLYYSQLGKCMYTGAKIELSDLMGENSRWDIDHIYPQSKIKDDSIHNNLVLVDATSNRAIKKDAFPIPSELRQNAFWHTLKEKRLITPEKFARLTRTTPFKEEELTGFINRQLVETGQATKALAKIFESEFSEDNTEVVYVKSALASDFRHEFKTLKVRSVNDLHHAKDAYLNIVCGNVHHIKFTKRFAFDNKYNIKTNAIYGNDVKSADETAWCKETSLKNVLKHLKRNNAQFTRFAYDGKDLLPKETIYPKGEGNLPIKNHLPTEKYGGRKGSGTAFFVLIDYMAKKGRQKKIVPIDVIDLKQFGKTVNEHNEFLQNKYPDAKFVRKLKINFLVVLNDVRYYISGKSGDSLIGKQAHQLILPIELEQYVKRIEKIAENKEQNVVSEKWDKVTAEENLKLWDCLIQKLQTKPYCNISTKSGQLDKISEEKFKALSLKEQCIVLSSFIRMFSCAGGAVDLKPVGGASHAGLTLLSSTLPPGTKIIDQSVTGLYEATEVIE